MYVAVGRKSKKIYVEADSKADCLRFLQKKYPYHISKKGKNTIVDGKPVYKEALLIYKRRRKK